MNLGGGRLCANESHMFDLALYFADDNIDLGFSCLPNSTHNISIAHTWEKFHRFPRFLTPKRSNLN